MSPTAFNAWLASSNRAPLVMGVLNVTPDSFSDGGRFTGPDQAVEYAAKMTGSGADWIDVGGESTRPGSGPVPVDEQIHRTIPVIAALRRRLDVLLSIDTTRGQVAEAALDAGANVVNDISAGRDDPSMLSLVAYRGASMILMHIRGTPKNMQAAPSYQDVTGEVAAFLAERRDIAVAAGMDRQHILLDPGIGFGKTTPHNLQLLRDTPVLAALGQPLVIGPSRKSFIAPVTGEERPEKRLIGTAAAVAWCVANGAAVVRVHDVKPIWQVVRMIRAIAAGNSQDFL